MLYFKRGQAVYVIDASKRKYNIIDCTVASERDGYVKVKDDQNGVYVFSTNEKRRLNGFFADSYKCLFLSEDRERCLQIIEKHNLRADIITKIREHSSEITIEQLKQIEEILAAKE